MWGQRLPKLLKLSKLQNVTFCPKTVKIGAKLKKTKTALSGVSQQSSCQGVCQSVLCVLECWSGLARMSTTCLGPETLSSLPQPPPADSSQVRAQEPCPAAQRPRESAYCSGSFPEKLQGPGALPVPRDVPR